MKVPLYILGFLSRYGPQHGYRLKQSLGHVSDFASIKLPTIYYHLEKMEKKGFISASREKEGKRPEKWVYTMTEDGRNALQEMLKEALKSSFRGEFLLDSALFFNDLVKPKEMLDALASQIQHLEKILYEIAQHKDEVLRRLPRQEQIYSGAIFRHHEYHYRAELQWLLETVEVLREKELNKRRKDDDARASS